MTFATALALLVPTKIAPPRLMPRLIWRERVQRLFAAALHTRLTVVVAPVGFGKSTLVAQWLQSADQAVPAPTCAWLTLDEHDREGVPFLAYIAAAIERVAPNILVHTGELLRAKEEPQAAAILQALLVDLNASQMPLVLVLDDYHLVTTDAIHHTVAYLVRHLPAHMRLVIMSRSELPFSFVRLRAEQQITEVRAEALRFTADEVAALWTQLHGGEPAPALVADLVQQTEGWPIAIQLAALMHNQRGPEREIRAVKYEIADYLAAEVFASQPDAIQQALLVFAIPERICVDLGAALLPPTDDAPVQAEALLTQILRTNLLLMPLEGTDTWYRFHPLFRELLLRRLQLELTAERIAQLQLRAAQWLEQAGWPLEALRLYIAAGARDAAGALVEQVLYRDLGRDVANVSVSYWLNQLPADLIAQRPGLALISARIAVYQMNRMLSQERIAQVEGLLAAPGTSEQTLPWKTFLGDLAIMRGAVLHYWHGEPCKAITEFQHGLQLGATPNVAGTALAFMARAYAAAGSYAEGVRLIDSSMLVLPALEVPIPPLVRHTALCMTHEFVGRIDALAQETRQFAALVAATRPAGGWDLYVASFQGRVAYEQADLATAETCFAIIRATKYRTNASIYIGCLSGLMQIALVRGDLAAASRYEQEVWACAHEWGANFCVMSRWPVRCAWRWRGRSSSRRGYLRSRSPRLRGCICVAGMRCHRHNLCASGR
jgi:LuxR family maltose regulon positive regulatory protein